MKIIKVTKEYFETEDERFYFFEPLGKKISINDLRKIITANEHLMEKLKNGLRNPKTEDMLKFG